MRLRTLIAFVVLTTWKSNVAGVDSTGDIFLTDAGVDDTTENLFASGSSDPVADVGGLSAGDDGLLVVR